MLPLCKVFIDNVEGYLSDDRSTNITSMLINRCDVWKELTTGLYMLKWRSSGKHEQMITATYDKLFEIKCLWSVGDQPTTNNNATEQIKELSYTNNLAIRLSDNVKACDPLSISSGIEDPELIDNLELELKGQ